MAFEEKIIDREKPKSGGYFMSLVLGRWKPPHKAMVVELRGRMGNQLFQYATARAAALRANCDVVFDTSSLTRDTLEYELGHFAVQARIGKKNEICPPKSHKLKRLVWRSLAKLSGRFIREKANRFEPRILKASGATELLGYWQNERYFEDASEMIRQELEIVTAASPENQRMLEIIESCCAVSVHVRRGDYVSSAKNQSIYARCSPEYYAEAVQLMIGNCSQKPHFFVFSDDPDWAEKNLNFPDSMTVVRINGSDKGYEDLRLMAACQHNIIANSTFSWWGAWLNKNSEKIIIGPKTWYLDKLLTNDLIYPESWKTIENCKEQT